MSYIYYNPNPSGKRTGDCVIRAIAKATGQDWERAYTNLCVEGYTLYDLPSSNRVWKSYLESRGFKKYNLPDTCPSRADGKEEMIENLKEMMNDSTGEQKDALRHCMEQLQRM